MRIPALAVLLLIVAGCNSSNAPNASPTITVVEPSTQMLVAPGLAVQIDYVDGDDGICVTSLYADLDGDVATTNDRIAIALDRPGGDGTTRTVTWDTTGVAAGTYTILAVASDGANVPVDAAAAGLITVNTPPSVSVTGPASDLEAVMGSLVRLTYVDNDPDDAATTDLYADGDGNLTTTGDQHVIATGRPEQNGTPQNVDWDTAGVPEGAYSILAVTSDGVYAPVEGTAAGTVTLVDTGMAIELFGDGGNVQFVNPLIGTRTTFTIEFWIKPAWPPITGAGVDGRNCFYCESYTGGGTYNGATRNFIWIGNDDPGNAFDEFGAVTLSQWPTVGVPSVFSSPLTEDVWQHLAFVQEGGTLRIYVNGVLEAQGTALSYTGPVPDRFHLGLRVNPVSGPEWCRAVIDEVRVSSVARYTADFTPALVFTPDASTLSLWHFDEASGTATADASGTESDATLSATAQRVVPVR